MISRHSRGEERQVTSQQYNSSGRDRQREKGPHLGAPPPSLAIRGASVIEHGRGREQPQARRPAAVTSGYRIQRHSIKLIGRAGFNAIHTGHRRKGAER